MKFKDVLERKEYEHHNWAYWAISDGINTRFVKILINETPKLKENETSHSITRKHYLQGKNRNNYEI